MREERRKENNEKEEKFKKRKKMGREEERWKIEGNEESGREHRERIKGEKRSEIGTYLGIGKNKGRNEGEYLCGIR